MPAAQCARCEYRAGCFPLLRLIQSINPGPCRQGRKRKAIRQSTIAEVVARCEERNRKAGAAVPPLPAGSARVCPALRPGGDP